MPCSRPLLAAAFFVALAGCSVKPSFINEYKIDVQQGNALDQDAVAQLKPGQTKDQVRFLLGTPLIADIFHQQRWDYVYRFKSGSSGEVDARRLTLFFDADNRLACVDGDVAAGGEDDPTMSGARTRVVDLGALPADAPAAPQSGREERGFFGRLWDKIGF
ncbi:MAG: outer membrane protein assembly factor BamE [Betaproteobacteria bacterium]|nr:outer membrane protein assembly factor BamE [Betaproteobacteria bacterium]